MNIGQGECEAYLSNVDYATIIESLIVKGVKCDYTDGKPKGFEPKYLDRVAPLWQYFVQD